MLLSEHEESSEIHAARLGSLFVAGIKVLNSMLQKSEPLTFHAWATRLGELGEVDAMLRADAQRKWLWDTLRTEASFKTRFGELPATTTAWISKNQRLQVFARGEQFEIPIAKTTVLIRTEEPLDMKPGKGGRLECCNCKAIVTIRVPETYSVEREADIMGIDSKKIKVDKDKGLLSVEVVSLNQAFTISSRRIYPKRRSHGGRTYDHVVHVDGMNRTLLENIRQAVADGT